MRVLSKDAALAADKPRLNLIFHGLMGFYDADAYYYDVLIPNTLASAHPHEARYGDPLDCPRDWPSNHVSDYLRKFKYGEYSGPSLYRIEGVPPADVICKPSPSNAAVLNGLTVDDSNVLIKIRVPKPRIIRHYRGTETCLKDITGGDQATQKCLDQVPDVIHEVTIFSYYAFSDPQLIGPDDCFKIHKRGGDDGHVWNLCMYSQPATQDDCGDDGAVNKMFVIKETGGRPTVNLLLPLGSDDGPPTRISTLVGIDCRELVALSELNASNDCDCEGLALVTKVQVNGDVMAAVPGGCGPMFGRG